MNINAFIYIAVICSSLLITAFAEKLLVPALSGRAKQPIYAEGPSWHIKKLGTPTMGGIGFLIAISISLLTVIISMLAIGDGDKAVSLSVLLLYCFANSAIGIIDDLTKIAKKENQGLRAKQKLILQIISIIAFLAARHMLVDGSTSIEFSFGTVELGIFYYVLSGIALLATVNCANLTDGIDGLASGVAFAVGISLLYISSAVFSEVAYVAAALIGGSIGFMFFNIHPAKIFMGDTGSLFLGAIVGSSMVMLGNPILLIFVGIVYLIEGASVIIQVVFFKLTGKRVFKMAPLHHHLEKCGFNENKIVICGMLLTLLSSIAAVAFYL